SGCPHRCKIALAASYWSRGRLGGGIHVRTSERAGLRGRRPAKGAQHPERTHLQAAQPAQLRAGDRRAVPGDRLRGRREVVRDQRRGGLLPGGGDRGPVRADQARRVRPRQDALRGGQQRPRPARGGRRRDQDAGEVDPGAGQGDPQARAGLRALRHGPGLAPGGPDLGSEPGGHPGCLRGPRGARPDHLRDRGAVAGPRQPLPPPGHAPEADLPAHRPVHRLRPHGPERVDHLVRRDRGQRHPDRPVPPDRDPQGRRAGKGHVSGLAKAYVLWNYLAKGDPQGYYGVDRDKQLACFVFAGKKEQARLNLFADLYNVINSGPCFAKYISRAQTDSLTIYAPHDFLRMRKLAERGVTSSKDMATFLLQPKESTLMAGRGPASFMQGYDEMAHVVASGANRSAEDVYGAATPALDQFGKDAFIIAPSSP